MKGQCEERYERGLCKRYLETGAVLSHSVVSNSLRPHGLKSTRLLCPWGFSRQEYQNGLPCSPPGVETGVSTNSGISGVEVSETETRKKDWNELMECLENEAKSPMLYEMKEGKVFQFVFSIVIKKSRAIGRANL